MYYATNIFWGITYASAISPMQWYSVVILAMYMHYRWTVPKTLMHTNVAQTQELGCAINIYHQTAPTDRALNIISMGKYKKDVTPLLTHWSYVILALTHRYHENCDRILSTSAANQSGCFIDLRCSCICMALPLYMHVHDDVIRWKHFPRCWPIVRGIHRSPVNSPHKGQWHGALVFSLICAWINGWANNGEAGDLRRHRAHYDVNLMYFL